MTWLNINRRARFFPFIRRSWFIPLVCCLVSCGSSKDSTRRVSIADESYFSNRSIFNNYTLADTLFGLIPCSAFDAGEACFDVSPIQEFTPMPLAKTQTSKRLVGGSRTLVPVAVRHGQLTFHGGDTLRGGAADRSIQESMGVPEEQQSYFIWFFMALAGGCLLGLFVCVLVFLKVGR